MSSTWSSFNSNTSEDERLQDEERRRICMAKAIKRNTVAVVATLPFQESENADIVIPECMTEEECERIRQIPDRRDQVRTVLSIVTMRSCSAMEKFLEILQNHNSDVHRKIVRDYFDLYADESEVIEKPCVYCLIKNSVDIKDVCDHFFQMDLISDALFRKVIGTARKAGSQRKLWEDFYNETDTADPERIMTTMIEALTHTGIFHKNLVQLLKRDIARRRRLKCRCQTIPKQVSPSSSASLSDQNLRASLLAQRSGGLQSRASRSSSSTWEVVTEEAAEATRQARQTFAPGQSERSAEVIARHSLTNRSMTRSVNNPNRQSDRDIEVVERRVDSEIISQHLRWLRGTSNVSDISDIIKSVMVETKNKLKASYDRKIEKYEEEIKEKDWEIDRLKVRLNRLRNDSENHSQRTRRMNILEQNEQFNDAEILRMLLECGTIVTAANEIMQGVDEQLPGSALNANDIEVFQRTGKVASNKRSACSRLDFTNAETNCNAERGC